MNYDPVSPLELFNMRNSLDTVMDSNILRDKLSQRSQNTKAYQNKMLKSYGLLSQFKKKIHF